MPPFWQAAVRDRLEQMGLGVKSNLGLFAHTGMIPIMLLIYLTNIYYVLSMFRALLGRKRSAKPNEAQISYIAPGITRTHKQKCLWEPSFSPGPAATTSRITCLRCSFWEKRIGKVLVLLQKRLGHLEGDWSSSLSVCWLVAGGIFMQGASLPSFSSFLGTQMASDPPKTGTQRQCETEQLKRRVSHVALAVRRKSQKTHSTPWQGEKWPFFLFVLNTQLPQGYGLKQYWRNLLFHAGDTLGFIMEDWNSLDEKRQGISQPFAFWELACQPDPCPLVTPGCPTELHRNAEHKFRPHA